MVAFGSNFDWFSKQKQDSFTRNFERKLNSINRICKKWFLQDLSSGLPIFACFGELLFVKKRHEKGAKNQVGTLLAHGCSFERIWPPFCTPKSRQKHQISIHRAIWKSCWKIDGCTTLSGAGLQAGRRPLLQPLRLVNDNYRWQGQLPCLMNVN